MQLPNTKLLLFLSFFSEILFFLGPLYGKASIFNIFCIAYCVPFNGRGVHWHCYKIKMDAYVAYCLPGSKFVINTNSYQGISLIFFPTRELIKAANKCCTIDYSGAQV